MKLQYLGIIFLLIILPIVMVLSQYIDYNIDAINLRHEYDTRLINSTYDALKLYQLNTVNNAVSDIPASKTDELEAAVNNFFNSISTNFGYTGYNAQTMKEYVPAVVFTLYDGYYIYSPFQNILTGVLKDEVDESYVIDKDTDGKKLYGLKPYVYYSCRYKNNTKKFDVIITYTLDNYITIQGIVDGKYVKESGYLIDDIKRDNKRTIKIDGKDEEIYDYTYDNVNFRYDEKVECLKEYLGDTEYPYAKLNGTKYYIDYHNDTNDQNDEIFYIDSTKEKHIMYNRKDSTSNFEKYEEFITQNNSAYRYYKDSYDLTTWVRTNLGELKTSDAVDVDTGISISEFGDDILFGTDSDMSTTGNGSYYIQDRDSIFNMHRSAVIRYIITKNLSAAIAGYKNYYNNSLEAKFIMPKISETDWETIENNVSIITFLQGFKIAGRDYNEYCVVANNLNKEYVNEDDIYILGDNNTYYKVNDTTITNLDNEKWLKNDASAKGNNYAPGVWKLNFERRLYLEGGSDDDYETKTYFPISYKSGSKTIPYIGSYSSIIASTSVDTSENDMYKYMRDGRDTDNDGNPDTAIDSDIKTTYYTALARERYGQYSVNNDIDIIQGNILNLSTGEEFEDDYVEEITLVAKHKVSTGIWEELKNKQWTKNDVQLIGKAKDSKSKIKGYTFNQNKNGDKVYTDVDLETITTTKDLTGQPSGKYTYYFHVKDGAGNEEAAEKTIYIDKTGPLIIADSKTPDEDWKNGNSTLKATIKDEHSGITNYTITKDTNTPSNYEKNISATTEEINIDEKVPSNGTYYLHVKDKVGNTSYEKIEVNDKLDTTAPIITVTPSSSQAVKNVEITIKIKDDLSGVKLNENGELNGKFSLVTTIDDEGNKKILEEDYEYTAKMNSAGELEAKVVIGEGLTGVYQLYIGGDVSDKAGNVTEEKLIGEFIFKNEEPDNEAPTVTVEVDPEKPNICQEVDVTITLKDNEGGSGLKSNQGTYYLSKSQEPSDNEQENIVKEDTFTSDKTFTIGKGLTGKYYLWVRDVEDNAGNVNKEHCVGEYLFDNTAPTIYNDDFKVTESTENSITVQVSAMDIGEQAVGIASYKYYILKPGNSAYTLSGENKSTLNTDSYTYEDNLNVGKKYSFYVEVADALGNTAKSNVISINLLDNYMITKGQDKQYKSTLADAVSVATNDSKITVLRTIEDNSVTTIDNIKNLTIDLNGNTLTRSESITITSTSTVEFIGKGYLKTSGDSSNDAIINGGKCTIKFAENNGVIAQEETYNYKKSAIKNTGNLIIESGLIQGVSKSIEANQGSILTINGGKIAYKESGISVYNTNNVSITINDGKIEGNELSTALGGIYLYNSTNCTLTVNNGQIISNRKYAIHSSNTENTNNIKILGGTISGNLGGIYCNYSSPNIEISGGTVSCNELYGGIYCSLSSPNIQILGGNVSGTPSGIYCSSSSPNIQILGGTVSGEKYGIGVKTISAKKVPEVTVGKINNNYNIQEVIIEGKEHAMYMNTEFIKAFNVYFYNGIIKTTKVNNEVLVGAYIQAIRPSYSIIDKKDDTSHYKYLHSVGTSKMYAVEDRLYSTLQEAISDENTKNGDTVVLLKDGTDDSGVELNKDITLLLNTFKLTKTKNTIHIGRNAYMTVTGNRATINNKSIIGFTVDGKIKMYGIVNMNTESESYPLFDTNSDNSIIDINNGIFTAEGSKNKKIKVVNIDNKSTCYIRGLVDITLRDYASAVYNEANEAKIYLEGGTIKAYKSYGVYNNANADCVLGGVIMEVDSSSSEYSYGVYNSSTSSGNISSTNNTEDQTTIKLNDAKSMGIYNDYNSRSVIKFEKYIDIVCTIQGGRINTPEGAAIYNAGSGSINISRGSYNGLVYGIKNIGTGDITISGGEIKEHTIGGSGHSFAAIYNSSNGKFTINDGIIMGHNCRYI